MKRPLCLICLGFVLALYCYMEWIARPSYVLEAYDGRDIELTGQIYQKEIKQDQFILYMNHVTFCDKQSQLEQENHKIICFCKNDRSDIGIGTYVQVKGRIQRFREATNPGEFDMRRYYHILGIEVQMKDVVVEKASASYSGRKEFLYRIRSNLSQIYDKYLEESDAGIMKAMVLGERQLLDKESKNLYQKAGIAHILAISGLHISMMGMAIYALLRKVRLPLPVCVFVSIFFMVQYGDMTGMGSSACRAIIMFGMRIASKYVRRSYDMLTAMMISCLLVLLENPLYIYHGGFQLSFGAMIGIGLMNPVFCEARLPDREKLRQVYQSSWCVEIVYYYQRMKQSLQGSIAISSVHFPILVTQYYSFPIYSFFLNLIVIPLLTILLGVGVLLLFLDKFFSVMMFLPARVIHLILSLYEWMARITVDSMRGSWITGCPDSWQIILYLLIIGILLLGYEKMPMWLRYMHLLAGIVVLTTSIHLGVQITMLDVGQGDGICLETQTGHCYLIDGGSTSKKNVGSYQMIPFLKYQGINQIEAVFLTHLDDDHIAGVKELIEVQREEGIRVKNVVLANAVVKDEAYQEILALCELYGVSVRMMHTGEEIVDGKLQIRCLFPDSDYVTDDRNAASLVLSVSCGEFKGLFTGDVSEEGELAIARELSVEHAGTYQLFKATHHGSKFSNTQVLLEQLEPQLTVISCGKNNRYGHPHEETLDRLADIGTDVRRTDDEGAIMIHIVGRKWWAEGFISSGYNHRLR